MAYLIFEIRPFLPEIFAPRSTGADPIGARSRWPKEFQSLLTALSARAWMKKNLLVGSVAKWSHKCFE